MNRKEMDDTNFKNASTTLSADLSEIRQQLGDDGASKVTAILTILEIGETSVAYAKATLAAAEMAIDRMTVMKVSKKDA